jgi:ATP-dependent exoDNAse (exonuclease V) alpha subunit
MLTDWSVNTSPPAPPQEGLSGLIERVIFHSEETGFAVLRVKVKGQRELVTAVGALANVNAGEWMTAQGNWVQDKERGLQFKATSLNCSPPRSREGIEKYLASGLIKGIGPVYAKKLVEKFGEELFTVIDNYSVRLEEVDGIGPGRRRKIKAAWVQQKAVRDIMIFLHSHGVSTSRAVRIYKAYGDKAIETVRAKTPGIEIAASAGKSVASFARPRSIIFAIGPPPFSKLTKMLLGLMSGEPASACAPQPSRRRPALQSPGPTSLRSAPSPAAQRR